MIVITLARKPLIEKTTSLNIITWGTGALNIENSRIGNDTVGWKGWGRKGGG